MKNIHILLSIQKFCHIHYFDIICHIHYFDIKNIKQSLRKTALRVSKGNSVVIMAAVTLSLLVGTSGISHADAELWELIVDSKMEKAAIYQGETVKIKGKVVDHAYEPIRGAEVFVRTGSETIKTFTDPHGNFNADGAAG